ncbi:ABC-three component system middle component 2 [Blastococcus xanthinilyticus]|uniref:Uncharacterized protein n=1 Tax=Blastococcus xanthinilyticus TaxID=1564164 RepID=A0A5S5CX34_9ACTN|nr:ABC-three component system middle component 2 [Blastococcus xanthinilyticus]TYP87416.1 hypothetical protein BD833_1063 [Blastococcus xanthinilyticus]
MTDYEALPDERNNHKVVVIPEDDAVFRLAQMLLLMDSLDRLSQSGTTLERLGCYDFLVANPMLVLIEEDDVDRKRLLMAGFDGRALSYASPAHRFTTRRERLQHDLALLVAYGLVQPTANKGILYLITDDGRALARRLSAVYAGSYRLSADILLRRLSKLSDKRLRDSMTTWTTVRYESPRPEALSLLDAIDLFESQFTTERPLRPAGAEGPKGQ